MGKLFLLLILCGGLYSGYAMYGTITKTTRGPEVARGQAAAVVTPAKRDVEDTGDAKEAVRALMPTGRSSPLPVVASTQDALFIESWGKVEPGDELPDGSTLESWAGKVAVCVELNGRRVERRFRRHLEALADMAPVAASVPGVGQGYFFEGRDK